MAGWACYRRVRARPRHLTGFVAFLLILIMAGGQAALAQSVTLSSSPSTFSGAGTTLTYNLLIEPGAYTITSINQPIVTSIKNVSITCPALPGGGLEFPSTLTCTGTYTTDALDASAGSFADIATVNATRVGSINFSMTSNNMTVQQAGGGPVAVSVTSTPNASRPAELVTVTATVGSLGCNAGSAPPGTATITVGSQSQTVALISPFPGSASSQASFVTSTLPVGTHAVSATYGGGSNCSPGSATGANQIVDTDPAVSINQAAGQADPTGQAPVLFSVVYDKPVTGFTAGDVQLSGTAGPTSVNVSGSGANYTVSVGGMTRTGTVIATIPANAAVGALSGLPNTASTSTDNTVQYLFIEISPASLPSSTYGQPYSETITASGGSWPHSFALSGSLPAGMAFSSAGVLSGTPTASGNFNFIVTATDSTGGSNARSYTLTVADPTITMSPLSLPDAAIGAAYAQTISATGGTSPYGFALTAGALPAGLSLESDGTLSGTPTAAGSFNFTVTGTDNSPNTGPYTASRAYTVNVAPPTISVSPAAGALPGAVGFVSYSQSFAATGGIGAHSFSLASGALPAGVSLSSGGTLSGTPTASGSYSFAVRATDSSPAPGPYASAPVSYSLQVEAPTITFTPATLPSGVGGVAYSQAFSATGGSAPFTFAVTVGNLPAGLSLATDGALAGTPDETGSFSVEVTATDAHGFTGSATYALIISAPVPTVKNRAVDLPPGSTARVDLTQDSTGVPITAATVLANSNPSAGSAHTEDSGGGVFELIYTAHPDASGSVAISYSLSNRWGASAPATVTFNIIARPDPSEDHEVIGLINAQLDSARRLARAQIDNFNGRLEQLHNERDRRNNSVNLQVGTDGGTEPLGYADNDESGGNQVNLSYGYAAGAANALAATTGPGPGAFPAPSNAAFWAGGFVNFGTRDNGSIDFDQTLIGFSAGVDYRFSPTFVGGVGVGFGRDVTDIGLNGTESTVRGLSAATYGSYKAADQFFIDGLLGYNRLDLDSRRFVTGPGGFAEGQRAGQQIFGSLAAAYDYRQQGVLISPYGRVEASWTRLDDFTETGAEGFNLAYGQQDMSTVAGVLGLRTEYAMPMDWGLFTPRLRVEYTHDFEGASRASLSYAALLDGLRYGLDAEAFGRDSLGISLGFEAGFENGLLLDLEYGAARAFNGYATAHALGLRIGSRF